MGLSNNDRHGRTGGIGPDRLPNSSSFLSNKTSYGISEALAPRQHFFNPTGSLDPGRAWDPFKDHPKSKTIISENDLPRVLYKNIAAIIDLAKADGINAVSCEYSGEGDRGNAKYVRANDGEGRDSVDFLAKNVTTLVIRRNFDTTARTWELFTEEETKDVESVMQVLTDHAIGHFGKAEYEDGDGGGGVFTIDAASDTYRLDHFEYLGEKLETSYSGSITDA